MAVIPDPQDQAELNKLYQEYIKLLETVDGKTTAQARILADAAKTAGNLTKEVNRLSKELDDTLFKSDYLYQSFRETTAELKNQNTLLQAGKSTFKGLTDIASDLKYFQQGITDLSDKQLRKQKQKLEYSKEELKSIVDRLSNSKEEYNKTNQILNLERVLTTLTGERKKRAELILTSLKKEEQVYHASKNALEEMLPILEKELQFSKDIFKARESLGGITTAAAKTISKYGGSLSEFLDINESIEAVEEYNKKIINNALTREDVLKSLHENELKRIKLEIKLETATGNDRKKILEEINVLEEENLAIKQKAIKSTDTLLNKIKTLGVFIQGLGPGLKKALTDPLTLITFFVTKALEANTQAVNLGKSLGISAEAATKLREESVKYVNNSKDTFLTVKRLEQAQSDLSEELGIAVRFGREELETQARLTELTGLSGQEAAKLNRIASATGTTTEKYTGSLRKAVFFAQQETKTHFSSQKILQEISKLSAGILVKFQGNPKALAQAVVEAKKLGTNLDTVDKIGNSLLDWESSIQNELEAELLTGREINLERARAAALSGDQLALTREISDQVGTLADFQNLNVIAQTSLAKSFGLSREEMAEMLIQQEAINKYGDKAAKLNKEQLADMERQGLSVDEYLKKQEQQQTTQQKFNDAIVQLQETIGNLVAGPLGSLINSLAKGLDYVSQIWKFFGKIGSVIKGFFGDKIGGILGDVASVATIGALIALVTRSMLKGTIFNPMIVKDISIGGMFGEGAGGRGGGKKGGKVTLPSGSYVEGGKAFSATGKPLAGAAAKSVTEAAAKQAPAGAVGKGLSSVGNFLSKNIGGAAQIGKFFGKVGETVSNVGGRALGGIKSIGGAALETAAGPVKGALKIVGKFFGPILTVVSGISNIVGTISEAKAKKAAGEQVNTAELGKDIIKGAAYPIANLLLNLIPGVGQALSLADAVLGAFGLSPIKWLTNNLIDWLPNDTFKGLGDMAINEKPKAMAEGGIVVGPTRALIGEAGAEAVIPLREFYAKMDEIKNAILNPPSSRLQPIKLYLDSKEITTAQQKSSRGPI
jgi:hypothetical protein